MARNQKVEQYDTPPYEEIPGITRSHLAYLESTNEESAWLMAGMKSIILRTIGRKSGKVHKVVLPYWEDEGGHRIITASYAGGPVNPGWYHNLADREANPKVWIKERELEAFVRADVLEGAEHERIWTALVEDRPNYREYLENSVREKLPLIRLVED